MRKFLFIGLLLASCDNSNVTYIKAIPTGDKIIHNGNNKACVYKLTLSDGHSYLLLDGGYSLCPDPECRKCKR